MNTQARLQRPAGQPYRRSRAIIGIAGRRDVGPYPDRPAHGVAEGGGEFGAGEQAALAQQVANRTAGSFRCGKNIIKPRLRHHAAERQGIAHGAVTVYGLGERETCHSLAF